MDVFILTYKGIHYFDQWFKETDFTSTTKFHIVDNGQQTIPERLEHLVVHRTKVNTGCAGGWNISYRIGFEYLKLEKMIMGQDDAVVTQEYLDRVWNMSTPNLIVGLYENPVKWSVVGMHRDFYMNVGQFDENCVYAFHEDGDYENRMRMVGKSVISLGYDRRLNASLTSHLAWDWSRKNLSENGEYMHIKWGKSGEYNFPFNDSALKANSDAPIRPKVYEVYGKDITEFPSRTEYKRFLENQI